MLLVVGLGDSVVGSGACVWKVAGSNPSLSAAYRDLGQVLHSKLPVALRRVNSNTVSML